MTISLSQDELDLLLSLQFSVAWAGEGKCEPTRHGWWQTALVDEFDGLDLLQRIAPRTAPWAALEAVRRVATHIDAQTRTHAQHSDSILTIFHLGFDIDELLHERLKELKLELVPPKDALPGLIGLTDDWTASTWSNWLSSQKIASTPFEITPGGRFVSTTRKVTNAPVTLVKHLIGALHTPSTNYPTPHTIVST